MANPVGTPSLRIVVDDSRLRLMVQKGLNPQPVLSRFFQMAGEETRKEMIKNIRVKGAINRGNLWGSIRVVPGANMVSVGPSVHYAPYVEYGTDPSPGRFLPGVGKRYKKETIQSMLRGGRDPGMHPGNKKKFGADGARFARDARDNIAGRVQPLFTQILNQYLHGGFV